MNLKSVALLSVLALPLVSTAAPIVQQTKTGTPNNSCSYIPTYGGPAGTIFNYSLMVNQFAGDGFNPTVSSTCLTEASVSIAFDVEDTVGDLYFSIRAENSRGAGTTSYIGWAIGNQPVQYCTSNRCDFLDVVLSDITLGRTSPLNIYAVTYTSVESGVPSRANPGATLYLTIANLRFLREFELSNGSTGCCNATDYVETIAEVPEVPEPQTFSLILPVLGLLAWRRKANPKP